MNLTRLLLSLACIAIAACEAGKQPMAADFEIGDQIVAAVERFRKDHGRYPQALTELVPTYLAAIKQPAYGQRQWDYVVHADTDKYALFVWGAKPHHDAYGLGAPEKKWERIENSF